MRSTLLHTPSPTLSKVRQERKFADMVMAVTILSFKIIGYCFFGNAALQARSGYGWECLSPDGFALHSKWNEAEKYICNPLSGEVPMECLSAKTLSGRSFRNFTNRITMSAPLVYPSQARKPQTKYPAAAPTTLENFIKFPIQGIKTLYVLCGVLFYMIAWYIIAPICYREESGGHDQRCGNPKHTSWSQFK